MENNKVMKVLYSPGFGAGWSTWIDVPTKFACEYQPIIDAIERGEKLTEDHPCVIQFIEDCKKQHDEYPYLGGLKNLRIFELNEGDQYRIEAYDGSESVVTRNTAEWN